MSEVILQSPRNIVSPRVGKQWDSKAPTRIGDAGFEEQLHQVCESVRMAETGHWPAEYLAIGNPSGLGGAMPTLLKNKLRISGAKASRNLALSVSMDSYWDLGEFMLEALKKIGVKYKTDKPNTVQFCDTDSSDVAFMVDLHQSCAKALDRVFDIKFFWEEPRPEDYKNIHGTVFTVDRKGAPGHWRFGAGHAALASATYKVLMRHLSIAGDLAMQVMHECFMFCFGRTPLGVHFIEDNLEGWRVGQQF